MLGLVTKDFLLMKSNIKSMIIIFIIYIVLGIQGTFDLSLILPLFGMILLVSTFNYDEYNNFNAYAITLPNGKKNIVKAKYISTIITLLLTGVLGIVVSSLIAYFKTNADLFSSFPTLIGSLLGIVFIVSIMYPLIYKFGVEKGRIGIFAFVFGGVFLVSAISKYVDLNSIIKSIQLSKEFIYVITPIILFLILYISYSISKIIFLKKEF